ncbi:MAG: hypothetical protein IJY09_09205 [Lachnospiraceae bacterium]|nr:hypothetical protein [Lachnospiraceae bacterium]
MYRYIYESYLTLFPFAVEKCRKKAANTMKLLLFPVLLAILYLRENPGGLTSVLLAFWAALFLGSELLSLCFQREEERMHREMNLIFSNVRHQYYCYGNVADAVYFALEGMELGVQLHLQEIYRILTAKNREMAEAQYKERVRNRFYRMFLLQAIVVEEHGEEQEEGKKSVFLSNLLALRKEAEKHRRARKRMHYLCSGLGVVSAAPVLCLNWIQEWAVSNLPELKSFYHGAAGQAVKWLGLLLSIGIYLVVLYIRWPGIKTQEEEVIRFQTILCMLKDLPGISTVELLERLEENAEVFREPLRSCMRELEQDEAAAFQSLREAADSPAFQKLADMFAMIEESGVQEAFAEITTEMEEFGESRRLEEEILQGKKLELATIIACIPGCFLLAGYLIIPFMSECFRQLEEYMGALSGAV